MERSIEAADLWGGRRWEGSGKGKGKRESTSKRKKEGVKTGKAEKEWRKEMGGEWQGEREERVKK